MNKLDVKKILVQLYSSNHPVEKFAKEIGRDRATVYRWLENKPPIWALRYLTLKLAVTQAST